MVYMQANVIDKLSKEAREIMFEKEPAYRIGDPATTNALDVLHDEIIDTGNPDIVETVNKLYNLDLSMFEPETSVNKLNQWLKDKLGQNYRLTWLGRDWREMLIWYSDIQFDNALSNNDIRAIKTIKEVPADYPILKTIVPQDALVISDLADEGILVATKRDLEFNDFEQKDTY